MRAFQCAFLSTGHLVICNLNEDVRFDAPLLLVKDGPDREIAFEGLEGGLDFDDLRIELPELGRVGLREIGAQELAPCAAPSFISRPSRVRLIALQFLQPLP